MYDNAVDSVQVPVKVLDKAGIKAKIDAIAPRGGTNLWGGTEKGYEYVGRNYKTGFINRVLLISDGLANLGLTDPKLIKLKVQQFKDDKGITLSTFGVGLDYNETLMTDMAETGLGNYYFIDAPEKLLTIFDKEINGLLNVAAQDAELKIIVPKGVKIQSGYPLKYEMQDNVILVKMRDLFSEETRGILFRFKIDNGVSDVLKFESVMNFTDVVDGNQKTLRNENILSPVKSADTYLVHFNKKVMEQTVLFTANENLENAMLQADKGDYDEANKTLNDGSKYLYLNAQYVDKSYELQRADSMNRSYTKKLSGARTMSADSIKMMQKANKAENYKLRNKKG
jgi:Ca-activated chloride channel family protein